MERERDELELIDLGAASTETQGSPENQVEFSAIARALGISDDA